MRWSRV